MSDIAMKLLEKQPEARYPNTEALLQALWVAGKERTSRAWKVPLLPSTEELPVEATPEEKEEWLSRQQGVPPEPEADEARPPVDGSQPPEEAREEVPPKERRTWRVRHLVVVSLALLAVLFLASWLVRSTLPSPHMSEPTASVGFEKGTAPVLALTTSQDSAPSSGTVSLRWLAVWLCTATGLGCPSAQMRPEPEACSEVAAHNTFEVLKLNEGMALQAIVDINQPGDPNQEGVYRDGPIVGQARGRSTAAGVAGGSRLALALIRGPIDRYMGERQSAGRARSRALRASMRTPIRFLVHAHQQALVVGQRDVTQTL